MSIMKKDVFAKGYTPNWSKMIQYHIRLNEEEIIRSFYDKELQKTNL